MAKHEINAGATSQRFYIYLQNSTTGQGQTGVTSATCYYLRDAVSGTMPAAVTLTFGAVFASPGTYPTWTSGQVREIGYMPGLYLVDIPDAVFAAGARNAVVQIFPVTGTAWLPVNLEFTLAAVNIYNSVNMGITALPNTAVTTNGSLITSGTGTAQLSTSGGAVSANTTQWGGVAVTGMPMPTYTQPTGFLAATFPTTVASPTNITAGTITTVSGNVNGSVNSVATTVTANTTQWGSVAVTGMPMPTYTQPTGFLAASFPTTVASPTNITAGTITTVSGNVNGSVNSVASAVTVGTINANAINAAAIATDAIDADAIANSAITIRLDTDVTASEARLVTGTVASDVYNAPLASYTLPNTFGGRLVRVRSTSPSNEAFITSANHIAADVHEFQPAVITAGDFADSALVIGSAAGAGVKAYLDTTADEGIADTVLNRNIAGGGNGTGATTDRTVRSALRALRNKSEIVGSTLSVYAENDTTPAWTAVVTTSVGANPVTGIDPAGP